MKREIKFRAWDVEAKEMCSWDDMKDGYTMAWCYDNEYWKLMQFTGLKDKNGTEIYEGDIVKLVGSDTTYTIEWVDYQFKMVHVKYNKMVWGCISRLSELDFSIEIIGSIYTTPELLTTK